MTGSEPNLELHAALLEGSAAEHEIQNITEEAERLMAGGELSSGVQQLLCRGGHH